MKWKMFSVVILTLHATLGTAQWDQYFARWEGKPGSMLVDMSVHASAPLADYPYLLSIGVAYQQCTADGFPDSTIYNHLTDLSDKLYEYMEIQTTCRLVGTFTHDCKRLDYYYLKDTLAVRDFLTKFYINNAEDYVPLISMQYDEDWNHYLNHIYPDLYIREYMMNTDVINQLLGQGDDIEMPRRVHHWTYFSDEESRDQYRLIVLERGFKEEQSGQEGDQYYYHFSRRDKLTPEYITELTVNLQNEAAKLNGEYDGWECEIVKKP